ncbi:unnamed protein product [Dracunculus medinensis]|uniref:Plasma membrane proteolipid 3 n=1 Tax=Dracunculus medinensis TaxID=318479 RepID=A0A0N4UPE1_DRAME|nr:unnamed protein product [Dracunculus medinensis]
MCVTVCELIFIIIFPPIAILIARGCDVHFFINIVLTIIGWIPGVIHAIYICFYYEPPGTAHPAIQYNL